MFLEIIRKLKEKPHLMRKVKIFVLIGFVGLLVIGILAIWAGISAMSYLSDKANVMVQSPQVQTHIQNLKTDTKGLSFRPIDCLGKAQSLLAIEPWLARPALENLNYLKIACFETATPVCEDYQCPPVKKNNTINEGKTI